MSKNLESGNKANEKLKAKITAIYSRINKRDGESAVNLAKKLMTAFSAGKGKELNPVYASLKRMIENGEISYDQQKKVFTYKKGFFTRTLEYGEEGSELLADIIELANLYHQVMTGFSINSGYVTRILLDVSKTLPMYNQSENSNN